MNTSRSVRVRKNFIKTFCNMELKIKQKSGGVVQDRGVSSWVYLDRGTEKHASLIWSVKCWKFWNGLYLLYLNVQQILLGFTLHVCTGAKCYQTWLFTKSTCRSMIDQSMYSDGRVWCQKLNSWQTCSKLLPGVQDYLKWMMRWWSQ